MALGGEGVAGRGQQLFVTRCETVARVGRRSVAVGFGNMVKVVMVGNERFEGEEGEEGAQGDRKSVV